MIPIYSTTVLYDNMNAYRTVYIPVSVSSYIFIYTLYTNLKSCTPIIEHVATELIIKIYIIIKINNLKCFFKQ